MFKPKNNQRYWYLDGDINWPYFISVESAEWDTEYDDGDYINTFRSRKEARLALKKVLSILK